MRKSFILAALLFCASAHAQFTPDTTNWIIPEGQWGYQNSDLDCVRTANTYVFGGALNLIAKPQSSACAGGTNTGLPGSYAGQTQSYTDGAVVAKTFKFEYGVVRALAKFTGEGAHCGIWLADATYTQASYTAGNYGGLANFSPAIEIDVADYLPDTDGANLYRAGAWSGAWNYSTHYFNPTQANEFKIVWNSSGITWYCNGFPEVTLSTNYARNVYPVLSEEVNTAASGTDASYPLTMQVYWIRICSDAMAACDPGDPTMIFEDEFNEGTGTTLQKTLIQETSLK